MKKFLLTAVLGMFAVAGFSQIKWDARVGMSMSNISKQETDMRVGYTFGLGMDYQFTDMWSLQSGLMFTSKGANSSYEEQGFKEETKTMVHYLDIPILAAAKFNVSDNMKFVVNAGPYIGIGLGGKAKSEINGESVGEDLKVFKKYDDGNGGKESEMNRFDLGLQYGVGLEISEHYLVNLSGQYGFIKPISGDCYNDKGEKVSPKNLSFMLSVGYRF